MLASPLLLKLAVSAFMANVVLLVVATGLSLYGTGGRDVVRTVAFYMCVTFFGSFAVLSTR